MPMLTTYQTIDAFEKTVARLSTHAWALKSYEADLPEGRSRDVAEATRLDLEKAVARLTEEVTQLKRWPSVL